MKDIVRNLLVDFGGVLIGLDRPRCISSFEKLGIRDVNKMIELYFQEGVFGKHEKGLISDEEFRNVLRSGSPVQLSDEQIDNAWCSFLTSIPQYKLDFLKKEKANRKIFLLSNTNNIHWQYTEKHIFNREGYRTDDLFDKVYLSYKLKMVKPDEEIFDFVLKDAGIKAEETLFIDDSEANCRAASQLGILTYNASASEDWTKNIWR